MQVLVDCVVLQFARDRADRPVVVFLDGLNVQYDPFLPLFGERTPRKGSTLDFNRTDKEEHIGIS